MATKNTRAPVKKKLPVVRKQTMGGPLSNNDKKMIQEWIESGSKSPEEAARSLRKSPKSVNDYYKLILSHAPVVTVNRNEAQELRRELHAHSSWESIQHQFTEEELLYFENDYVEYRKQFKDLTATEMKQLQQLITLDIFMQRHNIERIDNQKQIERLTRLLKREYERTDLTPADQQNILMMETQIQASQAASISRTKEYKDLLDKHQALLKDLKATREQRVKNLDQQGKFIAILKELEMSDRRKSITEITGIMDLAVEKEKHRLTQEYKFADGMIDVPILNHETLKEDYETEENMETA